MANESRRGVSTDEAPRPKFSYSQGIISAGLLFIAGQVPTDPVTGETPDLFEDQVRQTLQNLSAIARAAGASLHDAVRVNVFLEDLGCIHEMDPIYKSYFTEPFPVRTTIKAGLRGFRVEMDAIVAMRPELP